MTGVFALYWIAKFFVFWGHQHKILPLSCFHRDLFCKCIIKLIISSICLSGDRGKIKRVKVTINVFVSKLQTSPCIWKIWRQLFFYFYFSLFLTQLFSSYTFLFIHSLCISFPIGLHMQWVKITMVLCSFTKHMLQHMELAAYTEWKMFRDMSCC